MFIFSLTHIFIYFCILNIWKFCVYSLHIETRKITRTSSTCVCTYIEELHWKVFFSPNDLKLFWFYPWTKSFQWPFWNWEALTSWNDFFFFFKKKAWRLIEERPTIFLFLRNHNKNFGWKLCLIPLDSVN